MELNNQAAADKQRVQINTERVIEWIQKNDNQNGQKTVIIDHNFQNHESVPKKDNKIIQSLSTSLSTTAVKSQVSNVIAHNNEWMQSEKSGVGKSTWINAFANYLIYNTLEEAIAAEAPVCVIPTKFTMNDAKNQCHEVILGEHQNECFKSQAASTTQEAKTYFFETDEYNIYLIDTPGTNDTRGPEQDEENMQKILRAISPFKELHAICFLFKPNEYQNEAFRFCCAKFGGVKIKNAEIETYSESWTHSAQEISRLLKYAAQLRPNKTSDTLSINETRTWILRLINPTIQVSDIIQTNMQKLEERINELESIESNIEDLQKRAAVPITSLEIKRLNKPQTVCASRKCVQYEKIGGNLQTIYKTVCHKDCFF
uniref:G domain-containing protein n=1 Tax=Panagrolaimus superbus TaxID=310955 RepID=A0A914YN52_9BILA